jgi:L-cysteine S-thiosulfotransferase
LRLFVLLLLAVTEVCVADPPVGERRSGYEFMSRETRAMQDDEATNPGTFWVLEGESLFKACAACHSPESMKGVAARYPARDAKSGRVLNLEQRINACRTGRMKAPAFAYESRELLSLTAFVARQSRGMPIEAGKDASVLEGEKRYRLRQGQLNLSCAQCHDERWNGKLAGTPITQGHASGYPLYRLEWQGLGSLQRRLRNCLSGMRAELYPFGAPELVELEKYLMWRARGMKMESPAVRP